MKNESYKPHLRWEEIHECDWLDDFEEPCWGQVNITENYPGLYVYFCEGHEGFTENQPYKKEANNEQN